MQETVELTQEMIGPELYSEFNQQLDMTVYLLRQCLIRSSNTDSIPSDKKEEIKNLISQLTIKTQQFTNAELTLNALKAEDPITRMSLEKDLGLKPEEIEKIIATGFTTGNSILDEVPKNQSIEL